MRAAQSWTNMRVSNLLVVDKLCKTHSKLFIMLMTIMKIQKELFLPTLKSLPLIKK